MTDENNFIDAYIMPPISYLGRIIRKTLNFMSIDPETDDENLGLYTLLLGGLGAALTMGAKGVKVNLPDLVNEGYLEFVRMGKGSHIIYKVIRGASAGSIISVPSNAIGRGLYESIMKDLGIDKNDWNNYKK